MDAQPDSVQAADVYTGVMAMDAGQVTGVQTHLGIAGVTPEAVLDAVEQLITEQAAVSSLRNSRVLPG